MTNFPLREQPIIRDHAQIHEYATRFHVPTEDVGMIALNASGTKAGEAIVERGRFKVTYPDSQRTYFSALTLTSNAFSPFEHRGDHLTLDGEYFANATEVIPDTCTDTYWRDGTHVLTINTNSRANCHGCKFCGTYSLENDESPPLMTLDALRQEAEMLCADTPTGDLSEVEKIGVVTGCFVNERKLVEHLSLIRRAFQEFGFVGEIEYVGSQLRDRALIRELVAEGDLSLYITLEAFTRRAMLMKRTKASLTLDGAIELMADAKEEGADTSYLYITGLDPLDDMAREMPRFTDVLTRMPNIQVFQAYTPNQLPLVQPEAHHLDYFLEARKIAEDAYPNLLPIPSLNFRSLWYTAYRGISLPDTTNTIETR